MKVVTGSLPPGLQFGEEPGCEYTITGTPTHAGTYSFTVQITPQPDNLGQPAGPSGTQRLTITIGTGKSDRHDDGVLRLSLASGPDPCGNGRSCNVTVTDGLGSSVTATVPAPTY
jgi:hypothetical protein